MKKLILIFSLFAFWTASQAQVTLTVPVQPANAGQIASVPVYATGLTDILSLQFEIQYNTSLISAISVTNLHAGLSAGGWYNNAANDGSVFVSWLDIDPYSIPDGEAICTIDFIVNQGGLASLHLWNEEVADNNGNLMGVTNTDGSLTFTAPYASTTWTGTGNWYTFGNWSNGYPGGSTDAIIASGIVTVNDYEAITKNLTVSAGAGLTLNSGKAMSINGNFVLASATSSLPSGSFLHNSTAPNLKVTGTTQAQRWLEAGKIHMIGIPLQTATLQDFFFPANNGYFYSYNEGTGTWENPWTLTTQLVPSVGYLVDFVNDQMITLTGPVNHDASYSPTVTYTGSNGYNLVSNPYPTSLDWNNASGWTKTKVDNAVYVWNGTQYASYVGGVGSNGGSQYLAPFQGFFIHTNGSGPALSIKKAARVHNAVNFMKQGEAQTLRIALNGNGSADESVVYLNENATSSFDTEMDAYKLFTLQQGVPSLYTRMDATDYSINALPSNQNHSISLVTNAPVAGEYTFSFNGIETFESNYSFLLKDKLTGEVYDLRNNNQVRLNLSENSGDRFELNILKSGLGIGNTTLANANVYSNGQTLYFENCAHSTAKVYSVSGNLVMSQNIGGEKLAKAQVSVASGAYMAQITSQEGVRSEERRVGKECRSRW